MPMNERRDIIILLSDYNSEFTAFGGASRLRKQKSFRARHRPSRATSDLLIFRSSYCCAGVVACVNVPKARNILLQQHSVD